MTPSAAAVGKPVTLQLHDGRILHGTLTATDAHYYTLTRSAGTERFRRERVRVLQVREQTS